MRSRRLALGIATTLALVVVGLASTALADIKQRAELTAADGAANDHFGQVVAVDGHTLVVGAPGKQVGSNAGQGALYVYSDEDTGSWAKVATLTASNGAAGDQLAGGAGNSVAVSGNTIVAGVPGRTISSSPSQGCAYVFTRNGSAASGWASASQTELRASDAPAGQSCGEGLAGAVGISGDTLAFAGTHSIGLVSGSERFNGSIYIFKRAAGSWTQNQELKMSGDGCCNNFGRALAIDGSHLVVTNPVTAASASVYTAGAGGFSQSGTLTPAAFDPSFGIAAALSGNTAVVGGSKADDGTGHVRGAAYVFNMTPGASHELAKLTDPDVVEYNGGNLGASVAISGDLVAVGAPSQPAAGHTTPDTTSGTGMIDLWSKPSAGWVSSSKPIQVRADDAAPFSRFGEAVGLSDKELFVGSDYRTINANPSQGAAYVFGIVNNVNLKVDVTGSGEGTVKSDPAGIKCGKTCRASFDAGAQVKLIADPAKGSKFGGWSGSGCSGKKPTCKVTMSASRTVDAKFVKKHRHHH
jgi:hypothetical protein